MNVMTVQQTQTPAYIFLHSDTESVLGYIL